MNYHIEHAKYKYSRITVTGWLTGDTAEVLTNVWAEDACGGRVSCEVTRSEREDVREALFPQETQCLFGFRIKFPAQEKETYYLCLDDGTRTVRRKATAHSIRKKKRIADGMKEELRLKLLERAQKPNLFEEANPSPYRGAEEFEQARAVYEKTKDVHVKFSFVIPAYNTDREHLADMLESVWKQTYDNWEVCLADGSEESILEDCRGREDTVSRALVKYLTSSRTRYVHMSENRGISGNSNAALELAQGDYVVMVDHDDILAKDALEFIVRILAQKPDADFIYSDSDLTDHDNLYEYNSLFKPVWSPETLLSANYITHLSVVRTQLLRSLGGWRSEYDGAQDWDLFLRIGEATDQIWRTPHILYHWRAADGSTARNVEEKPYARTAQLRAVQDHLDRIGVNGRAVFADRESTCIRVELASSEGDILLKKTPDTEVSPEAAAELRAWASLPGIGVVCPRVVNARGRIVSQGILLKNNDVTALFENKFPGTAGILGHTDWYRDHVAAEPLCYAVSRRVWDEVGGPDESLGDLAMIDFCLRVERAGYRNMMTPFAQVSGETSITRNIRLYNMGAYKQLFKKYEPEDPV